MSIAESKNLTEEKIPKLLDEYREENEEYNATEWSEYLENKGYKVRGVQPDNTIYF